MINKLENFKKRLIYRSSYRGIKEMDILLSKFVNKYIDTLNYDDLVKLYEILKNDDDKIFKWYSGIGHKDLLPSNNVSKLLKDFKIKFFWRRGWDSNPRMSKPIASFQD